MTIDTLDRLRSEPATRDDVGALADLIVIAGEGLPLLIWQDLREPGETTMDVGRRRAARETGGFSYRNAMVVRNRGAVASALVSYAITEPTPGSEIENAPPVFRPLLALENVLTPSWYVNVLATVEGERRQGAASMLLQDAERKARAAGFRELTLITGDNNPARTLYKRFGFVERDRQPIVKQGWRNDGAFWIAYAKPLPA